jgi:hypothetical protein
MTAELRMRAQQSRDPFRLISLLSLFLVSCFGCHGKGGGGGGGAGNSTTVQILNKQTSIPAGSQFVVNSATKHNHGNPQGVMWMLIPATGEGTLSNPVNGSMSSVIYTAQLRVPNCVTITATSIENPSSTDSDTFSITAGSGGATVTIIEPSVQGPQVVAGLTLNFEARVQNGNGNPVSWGVQTGDACTNSNGISSLGTCLSPIFIPEQDRPRRPAS